MRSGPIKTRLSLWLFILMLAGTVFGVPADSTWVHDRYTGGDFKLVQGSVAANLLVSPGDFKVVQIATENLGADIQRVTGTKPEILHEKIGLAGYAVIVGTVGKSLFIDSLAQSGKLNLTSLQGKWESFLITTVARPFPGVEMGLVIAGSDRRGTAYGVFELSQAIGVSPWYWWADVAPLHHDSLFISPRMVREGPPSVQYRGIFLNDEDLGLQPWAAKTFDPELGDIGPKTYARVFELLLRLKANTLWPAMHGCTKAFNLYPDNKRVADDYAIVMGSSHAEPMLRNNVTEWTDKPENYDYTKNADGVHKYWEERASANGRYENIYTLGMRGIHDSPIQGPKTSPERIKVLEQIFADQRAILAKHVNAEVTRVPQIFCPYKEVLTDYRNGLKVPGDVTIVWPDDNFGYIRYLPTAEERKRPGGFGIYYHISYLGGPLSYLWLDTTPPSLIWEEMSKAYDHGVRKFWMLNVGDLKPGEISIDLFMQMGWDISRWRRENLNQFLVDWARPKFGPANAGEIAEVMREYYRLGFARKPEFLQWNLVNEKRRPSDLTQFDYGDEVQQRLDAYDALMRRVDRLFEQVTASQRDALYELVVYPVRGSALANTRYLAFERSAEYLAQGRASSVEWSWRAEAADARMKIETEYFNEKVAGGKWRRMMTIEPPNGQWQNMRMTTPVAPLALANFNLPKTAGLGVAIEGRREPLHVAESNATLPEISAATRDVRFIDVFNTGSRAATWTAGANQNWIKLSRSQGDLCEDARILVSIDWARAPRTETASGQVEIKGAGSTFIVNVPIINSKIAADAKTISFAEVNGVISIEAEHFTRLVDHGGAGWRRIEGLGRSGDSIAVFPTSTVSRGTEKLGPTAPAVEYQVNFVSPGKVSVDCHLVPTHPIVAGQGLRYAIGFDDQAPQVVTVGADLQIPSRPWSLNVLNSITVGISTHEIARPGPHVLRIYMVDAGVVLDKIVIDAGGLRPSYLGPRETMVAVAGR
jgi:hypothetical protein